MELTIIGSGFAGLAAAYYSAKAGIKVRVISSPNDLGASQIAAGLIHRFAGAHAKANWRGLEAMAAAEELFRVAGQSVILQKGVLRLALSDLQLADFRHNASQFEENSWRDEHSIPGVVKAPSLWIPNAYTIQSPLYLASLRKVCEALGVVFEEEEIKALPDTPTIVAAGASLLNFVPHADFSVTKGQLLKLSWPKELPPLPHAVNSKAYIVMDADGQSCWVGATYEKKFKDNLPDVLTAKEDIMPKAVAIIPLLKDSEILDCQAGLRIATPTHLPKIISVKPKCWALTGFGSKGLLYHALMAKELVQAIRHLN